MAPPKRLEAIIKHPLNNLMINDPTVKDNVLKCLHNRLPRFIIRFIFSRARFTDVIANDCDLVKECHLKRK